MKRLYFFLSLLISSGAYQARFMNLRIYCHGSLSQVPKFISLDIHDSFWNVVLSECFYKLSPGDGVWVFHGILEIFPPLSC